MQTERFTKILGSLQELQRTAMLKGIHSFQIDCNFYRADPELGDEPDEYMIYVTVFRTEDVDDDSNYLRVEFLESYADAIFAQRLARLRDFIGEV